MSLFGTTATFNQPGVFGSSSTPSTNPMNDFEVSFNYINFFAHLNI